MKRFVLTVIIAGLAASQLSAQVRVRGYTRSDGTYVAPHYRSSPNGSTYDNYSTRGNVNPYTGQAGTRDPSYRPPQSSYSQPRVRCSYNCPR